MLAIFLAFRFFFLRKRTLVQRQVSWGQLSCTQDDDEFRASSARLYRCSCALIRAHLRIFVQLRNHGARLAPQNDADMQASAACRLPTRSRHGSRAARNTHASLHSLLLDTGWLGSRVVSVLDSDAEGPGFESQPRRCRVTVLGKLFTAIVPL